MAWPFLPYTVGCGTLRPLAGVGWGRRARPSRTRALARSLASAPARAGRALAHARAPTRCPSCRAALATRPLRAATPAALSAQSASSLCRSRWPLLPCRDVGRRGAQCAVGRGDGHDHRLVSVRVAGVMTPDNTGCYGRAFTRRVPASTTVLSCCHRPVPVEDAHHQLDLAARATCAVLLVGIRGLLQ